MPKKARGVNTIKIAIAVIGETDRERVKEGEMMRNVFSVVRLTSEVVVSIFYYISIS